MPPRNLETVAVIVAAGRGTRLSLPGHEGTPKQYLTLGPRTMLGRTLTAFLSHPSVDATIAVIGEGDEQAYQCVVDEIDPALRAKLLSPTHGGASRQASVACGLKAVADSSPDRVLIHDAARPFVSARTISAVIDGLEDGDGALPVLPIVDTVKRVSGGIVVATERREALARAQTPQGFRFAPILAAHLSAAEAGRHDYTDDAAVAEAAGVAVHTVEGDPDNVKITTPEDLAEAVLRMAPDAGETTSPLVPHVGTGFDVHAFRPGNAVRLCGVDVPHDARLSGHSDADVAMHALTDAIYGALADGDIGHHFPPTDPRWQGADSSVFLNHAMALVTERGGRLAHADITIICERPKVGPHRAVMRTSLAGLLGVAEACVSVKATTSEKLGFTGRREGIAAQAAATVLLPEAAG